MYLFTGPRLGLDKRMIKALDVLGLVFRIRANHAKCRRRCLRRDYWGNRRSVNPGSRVCGRRRHYRMQLGMQLRMRLRALRLDGLRRSAKVPLGPPLFLQLHFLAENIFVLRVGLRQIVESEALPEL